MHQVFWRGIIAVLAFPLFFGLLFGFNGLGEVADKVAIFAVYGSCCGLAVIAGGWLARKMNKDDTVGMALISSLLAFAVFLATYGSIALMAGDSLAQAAAYLLLMAIPTAPAIGLATFAVWAIWQTFPIKPPQAQLSK